MTLSKKNRAKKTAKKIGKKAAKTIGQKASAQKASKRKASRKLLEMLICPVSHKPLRYDAVRQELISDAAALAYPIRDGVPIMLVKEARIIK